MKKIDIFSGREQPFEYVLSCKLYSKLIHLIGHITRSQVASSLLNDTVREKLNNEAWRLIDVNVHMQIVNALDHEVYEQEVAEARKKYDL